DAGDKPVHRFSLADEHYVRAAAGGVGLGYGRWGREHARHVLNRSTAHGPGDPAVLEHGTYSGGFSNDHARMRITHRADGARRRWGFVRVSDDPGPFDPGSRYTHRQHRLSPGRGDHARWALRPGDQQQWRLGGSDRHERRRSRSMDR